MNPDLLDILSNSNKDIDNQLLMDYLSGKLSGNEKHAVEQWMADNDFMNDAVEGLENIPDKKKVQVTVEELNRSLQKSLRKRKIRRERMRPKENPWTYLAILVILMLCIATYFILHRYLGLPHLRSLPSGH
ncbi:MAG: hypothetical protein P4L51_12695 [Puia sp.]|nr:hypothetical protein [Puia sp.]